MKKQTSKPVAVLISDIHFTLSTLELASQSLLKAQLKARYLNVPLILCGDTLDSKAIIRAEVANKLLQILLPRDKTPTYVLVGNHDMCNERGEEHALNFLRASCIVVDTPKVVHLGALTVMLVPYYSDKSKLEALLEREDNPRTLIMHQGVIGASQGHYIQDHSALELSTLASYRSIGGHYHNHHTVGNHTFIGNPYSLTFGETEDHTKGFCVLHDDGSLEHVPTNLRKHMTVNLTAGTPLTPLLNYNPGDLVWVKITGPSLELDKINRIQLASELSISDSFRFDAIPTDEVKMRIDPEKKQTDSELLDALIDTSDEKEDNKSKLKSLYREVLK